MIQELELGFAKVTEAAAIASFEWIGKGKKEQADQAGVDAMRNVLNSLKIDGEIVIGEGEIDEAPMLYMGEKIGDKNEKNLISVDIAVDPVEGTRMVAQGQGNSLSVIAVGEKGSFLKAPDMYMEKLVVCQKAKGKIDLSKSLIENIQEVSFALNKEISKITIAVLDKPRHKEVIKELQNHQVKVLSIPDGDVVASVLTCMENSEIDMLYGIGGAPEGVISAAVIKSLGGDMQARLLLRSSVKGDSLENIKISKEEQKRCDELGVVVGKIMNLNSLVKGNEMIFSATGITSGELLEGVKINNRTAITQTLLIKGKNKNKTIRYINTVHDLSF